MSCSVECECSRIKIPEILSRRRAATPGMLCSEHGSGPFTAPEKSTARCSLSAESSLTVSPPGPSYHQLSRKPMPPRLSRYYAASVSGRCHTTPFFKHTTVTWFTGWLPRSAQLETSQLSRDRAEGGRLICYGGQIHFAANRDTLSCHWPPSTHAGGVRGSVNYTLLCKLIQY